MTRNTNARVAGITFLFYIAVAYPALVLERGATSAQGTAAQLALLARHAPDVRAAIALSLLGCLCALVLGVTLYGITRDEDHELAVLAMACRIGEGVLGGVGTMSLVGLLRLATAAGGAADAAESTAVAGVLLRSEFGNVAALFFALGSTIFSYLLLRGRIVPVVLGWFGLVASAPLVLHQLAQLAGLVGDRLAALMWLPPLAFELALATWLLAKGAAPPARKGTRGVPAATPSAVVA